MKKTLCILFALILALGIFAACGNKKPQDQEPSASAPQESAEKLRIVTTIFPMYDWIRQILGDRADQAELSMLINSGVDLHSFQPSAEDILKVSECDLFVYVGGESDEWVEDILETAQNKKMVAVNLLEALGEGVKTEEVKEGMEADHDHEHEHEEIEAEEIKDRTLEEFAGEWKSLYPMLQNGELDAYAEHEAEEDGSTKEEALKELSEKWNCEATEIRIDGNHITFVLADKTTKTAAYTYAGYSAVKDEDGDITGVRYQFETKDENAPKYVQFNDHGHEPTAEVEHFHVYFGDESFETLLDSESNPFFVPAASTADEILEELTEGHHHEEEYDEHVWLSLKNASVLCNTLCDEISGLDPNNKAAYEANTSAYVAKLDALDAQYQAAVDAAKVKTLLFGDRFPFRYLADDYGLDYYAAFVGCSAASEASFETIAFLAEKVDELGLKAIMQIESADGSIANTIRETTKTKDQKVLTMNSLQSTTSTDVAEGATYLAAMEENLTVLQDALQR